MARIDDDHLKTPSPPKMTHSLQYAKKLLTTSRGVTNNNFKRPPITARSMSTQSNVYASNASKFSAIKRIQASANNRLFETPSSSAFTSNTDDLKLNKNTSEDIHEKLKKLADIGLYKKLQNMKFTRPVANMEEDEDEDDSESESKDDASGKNEKEKSKQSVELCEKPKSAKKVVTPPPPLKIRTKSEPNLHSATKLPPPHKSSVVKSVSATSISDCMDESASELRNFKVRGKVYVLLNKIGQGGSAEVYQVFEPSKKRNLALKVVDLSKADASTRLGYENEVGLLRKLSDCKRVVRLIDYERIRGPNGELKKLFLVMEKGDADLSNVLKQFIETDSNTLDPHVIKHYWKEMLKAVDEIHSRDVVHSDLKPVNFITVSGKLKLIDFGIANAIQSDHTSVIKDTQIGTINYMAPEALDSRSELDPTGGKSGKSFIKFNCKADVWSLGCILYNLVYGKPPFGLLPNLMAKVRAITNSKYVIDFPPVDDKDLIDCMKRCLERNPRKRPTAKELLAHPYLNQSKPNSNQNIVSQINELNLTPNRMGELSKFLKDLSRK